MLTIGFARRVAKYKRHDLIFSDPAQLVTYHATSVRCSSSLPARRIPTTDRPGRHSADLPFDEAAPRRRPHRLARDYDMDLARLGPRLDSGSTRRFAPRSLGDVGDEGGAQGVPSLSILDGWLDRRPVEDVTGWSIGLRPCPRGRPRRGTEDARDLYHKLRCGLFRASTSAGTLDNIMRLSSPSTRRSAIRTDGRAICRQCLPVTGPRGNEDVQE